MFNSITKLRFTLAMLMIAALTFAIYKAGSTQASATAGTQSVIVQLRDDPAAVYKARSKSTTVEQSCPRHSAPACNAPSGGGSGSQSSSTGLSLPGINLQSVKSVMRFTVNPLTGGVAAQFVLK